MLPTQLRPAESRQSQPSVRTPLAVSPPSPRLTSSGASRQQPRAQRRGRTPGQQPGQRQRHHRSFSLSSKSWSVSVSMRTTLRTLPRPMWVLVFGTFLNRFGDFVYVFLVLYLTQHGYTAPQAGLAIGSYGVGSLVAAALGGRL